MENPKILVVDDEELRSCIGEAFRGYGYRVDIADGVLSAIALMKKRIYDVILTDKNMPGLHGSRNGGFDKEILKDKPVRTFRIANGIVFTKIDPDTG